MMRVKYIDVIKAIAIIAVVLYHAGLMKYGYLGVDIFLVIAGYLTTKSLSAKMLNNDLQEKIGGYFSFEFSRVTRLLPPLLFACFFCLLLGFFVMLPDDYENLSESVIASNFFANNILAALTTKNYWDITNEFKPLMHTWYVGVIMQFYLFYPLLFYVAKKDKKTTKRTLVTLIGSLGVLSLLFYLGITNEAAKFYYLPSRFFEFALGGIVALTYNPQKNKPFGRVFVFSCYALILLLMFVNVDVLTASIRLLSVVFLSAVLISSYDILENRVTGNELLAKIGAASYSIFIWHQILLAFCRYVITPKFTAVTYLCLLSSTALMSWLSYRFIEQRLSNNLFSNHKNKIGYSFLILLFVGVNAFAGFIYMRAGVVRDVPELYISKNDIHRGMHAEYVDRSYNYDKPFNTDKKHWYIVGNSFGRDFVNIILESPIVDSIEVSYSTMNDAHNNKERFEVADRVFISTLGLDQEKVAEVELLSVSQGLSLDKVIVVGEKNFGTSNGIVYSRRNHPGYFEQYIDVDNPDRFINQNEDFAELYGDRFLDLMSFVKNDNNQVRVFTPDHHFISADCRHLSKGGAIYFASVIDWQRYLSD